MRRIADTDDAQVVGPNVVYGLHLGVYNQPKNPNVRTLVMNIMTRCVSRCIVSFNACCLLLSVSYYIIANEVVGCRQALRVRVRLFLACGVWN
ncbi:hypothetical protein EON65_26425 [archaeon]|nr:MAG: hypothetical protein EON65_26425 [archaeon]